GVRGSAAASLVLYVLGVTDIDPVANRLVFERFLNIERREMPDVDFDFADDRREEMIRFAYERYGSDRVAQLVPNALHTTLNESLEQSSEMKEMYGADPRVKRLLDTARQLEGVSRH